MKCYLCYKVESFRKVAYSQKSVEVSTDCVLVMYGRSNFCLGIVFDSIIEISPLIPPLSLRCALRPSPNRVTGIAAVTPNHIKIQASRVFV